MGALKAAALRTGYRAGLFRLAQFARRRQAVVLTFHRFWGDGQGDPRGLSIASFAEDLEYLTQHYHVVQLGEMTDALRRRTMPLNMAAITIDDGYHEVFSLAAPILKRYGVRASIFVVSDFIDGRLWLWHDRFRFVFEHAPQGRIVFRHRGSTHACDIHDERDRWCATQLWCERAKRIAAQEREEVLGALATACGVALPASPPARDRPMTWEQLRALAAAGFDVGGHTSTHPILSQLSGAGLDDEIAGSKSEIERHLRLPVRHFAYPNGRNMDYAPESVAAVARAGYVAAVTTIPGGNTPETPIFELRRISDPEQDLPHFVQAVTGVDLLKDRLRTTLRKAASEQIAGGSPVC